jgi:hypothetical protein
VHLKLLLVVGELGLRFLQLDRELPGDVTIAGLEVRFDLRLELGDVRFPGRHLTRHRLDEAAIHLEPLSPFLEPLGRLVDLELHHRDRVSLEEDVRDLVELCAKRSEEFPHGGSCCLGAWRRTRIVRAAELAAGDWPHRQTYVSRGLAVPVGCVRQRRAPSCSRRQ